jgi:DNA polymerase I
MKKIILVDGNNLMFRSYFATAYSGNLMKNSKGEATNALYGFTTMINKIIDEEKPSYMAVAFDIGKNFRHEKYKDYKAGRAETPTELLDQMPKARTLLEGMGIKHYEVENYEADDIIGTIALMADKDPEFEAIIVSSDRDLLQLISDETVVKLLKTKDNIRYNQKTFKEDFGIDPIRIIDLKALAGDASDNVPGVKGVGDKTALKLLQEYGSIENIYNNIDSIKGALHDKLVSDKDSAFFSKEICTIYREVPLKDKLEDMVYTGPNDKLNEMYEDLEFYSFLKKMSTKEKTYAINYTELKDVNELKKEDIISYYIECDNENYHEASVLGMGLYDGKNLFYVNKDLIKDVMNYLKKSKKYTYDLKKNIILLKDFETNTIFDNMVATYLLNYQIKDDLAVLMNKEDINCPFYEEELKDENKLKTGVTLKAKYIFDTRDDLIKALKLDDMYDLFNDTEMPLITVLARMEYYGVKCDKDTLKDMSEEIKIKIDNIAKTIYNYAGCEFNISSPKQLGSILFDHLGLPYKKKLTKTKAYSTDASVLEKLSGTHPIIDSILEYRNLSKLNSTYLEGLNNYILADGKIHTIYKQTLTRTGRLSSIDPNLQNIPARDENDRKVRKAFLPENDMFMCADYSQIELRVLAHISGSKDLIDAFKNGEDIHTKVAADIYGIKKEEVTKTQRRTAKAVIFGIVYGISGFGLGENLNLKPSEAKKFIDKYLTLYPGVKEYMDNIVAEALLYGSVRTLYNRKRVIDELSNKNYMIRASGERIALNTPIQGTSADIIKMAMVKIDKEMQNAKFESKMLLQVHDELIFDVKKSEKDKLEKLVKDVMENIVTLDVPLKVGIDYGDNWYEAK